MAADFINPFITEDIYSITYPDYTYRIPTLGDVDAIFELRSNPIHNQHLDRPLDRSKNDALAHIQTLRKGIFDKKWIIYVITRSGKNRCLGLIGFYQFTDAGEAEIGYEILPSEQGKGIASIAIKRAIHIAQNELQLKVIKATISSNNIASIALVKKAGFRMSSNHDDRNNSSVDIWELAL